ncbi:hypothetical protein [Subtercola boreus]|nr:hypothetical protein [Subtercola boreus]TQL53949.1 hypothetical protein FB464_1469 [Subtercola boreus]
MPGNPWPRDMVISIDENDALLVRLLFVRAAWGLGANGVPAVVGLGEVGTGAGRVIGSSRLPPDVGFAKADYLWRDEWERSWERFDVRDRRVRPMDARQREVLDATPDADLGAAYLIGPSRFWSEGIDEEAFDRWNHGLFERTIQGHRTPLEESPERRALPALVSAWKTGLTNILQLPFAGDFAERINANYLVVSEETRLDAALYSRALALPSIT